MIDSSAATFESYKYGAPILIWHSHCNIYFHIIFVFINKSNCKRERLEHKKIYLLCSSVRDVYSFMRKKK